MHTIIIADDDVQMLAALKVRLEAEGYEVHAAQDSYFALELARKHEPDALVLDINMPAGDGFSVQQRIQNVPTLTDVPIIYITGEHSQRVTSAAADLGAFALIHKPFETDQLLDLVREAVACRAVTGKTSS